MKLFKISFISIISILIFQSQLYGINLSCDFKHRVNDSEFNGVDCSDSYIPICGIDKFGIGDWTSEVIIRDKDIVILSEVSTHRRDKMTNKEIRKWKKDTKEELKVESIVHEKHKEFKTDMYVIVFKREMGLTSLFFDNNTKKSIIISVYELGEKLIFSRSYFGECEILD